MLKANHFDRVCELGWGWVTSGQGGASPAKNIRIQGPGREKHSLPGLELEELYIYVFGGVPVCMCDVVWYVVMHVYLGDGVCCVSLWYGEL